MISNKAAWVIKTVTGSGAILKSIRSKTISGYEIHMEPTKSCAPVFGDDGCIDESWFVIGTYLHGLFENENIRHALMSYLHEGNRIEYVPQVAASELDVYEGLADVVRKNIDMAQICEIIGFD